MMKHDRRSLRRAERHISAALVKADMPGWQADELEKALECVQAVRQRNGDRINRRDGEAEQ